MRRLPFSLSLFVLANVIDSILRSQKTPLFVKLSTSSASIGAGFESAYEGWEAMRAQDKTWVNLKIHFGAADVTRSKILLLQTPSAPTTYPRLANSATTSTTPPTQVELLTTAVNKLVKAMNKTSTAGGGAVAMAAAGTTTTPRLHTPVAVNPPGGREPMEEEAGTMSYCWSHGYCLPPQAGAGAHTGATCTWHRISHEVTAKANSKMGGKMHICNSWPRSAGGTRRQQQRE
jgi:hypothetical protein